MENENSSFLAKAFKGVKLRFVFIGLLLFVMGLSLLLRNPLPLVFLGFAIYLLFYTAMSDGPYVGSGRRIPSITKINEQMGLVASSKRIENKSIEPIEQIKAAGPIHSKVFDEAAEDIDNISIAASAASGTLSTSLNTIIENIQKIIDEINDDPKQFSAVSRLFTYYVPEINNLLRVRGALVRQKDKVKIKEIDTMIGRLAAVSNDFLDKVEDVAISEVDIDLKLLDQSLAQEIKINLGEKV